MNRGYPDIAREVKGFLSGFDRLVRLPLISDSEVEGLFGADLTRTLERLKQYDQEEHICAGCSDRCCALIKCELYDPAFGTCPAYSWRPLLCRMHYCHKFDAYQAEVKIIGDIFLECLLAAQQKGSRKTVLFDSPPLRPAAPELATKSLLIRTNFQAGRLDKMAALLAIQIEVEKYRMLKEI